MEKKYNTRHSEHVLAAIKNLGGKHFTAEQLLTQCKINGENIGLSTVYRQLDKLVKEGRIRKFASSAGESACYQEMAENCEHFHLKCTKCGRLEHLSCNMLEAIAKHVSVEHSFEIDPSKTVFYGVCAKCGKL